MRVRRGGLALAGMAALAGAAALAMGLGALSSAAATATTWTVHPGGIITAKAAITRVKDTTTNSVLNCKSSRMSGRLKAGTGLPGTGIGSITAAAYDCALAIGPPFRLTPHGLPWHLNLASYDAGTGVSRGTISHLEFTLAGPSCSAMINGTGGSAADGVVAVSYTTKTGTLQVRAGGGNLHWYQVSGCAGLLSDGDHATLSAGYTVSPRQRIASP